MEHIEKRALATTDIPPKWWVRYVDDSHCCLQKESVEKFHQHLNSINTHIKFTEETEDESGLAFLDTNTKRTDEGNVVVDVYRKPIHTDKYLDFNSHHPATHKRSVAKTLLERAFNVPSNEEAKAKEVSHVKDVLKINNNSSSFISNCETAIRSKKQADNIDAATSTQSSQQKSTVVVLPYVRGTSERLKRMLKQYNLQVAHQPTVKVNNMFPRPKQRETVYTKELWFIKLNATAATLYTTVKRKDH